MKFLRTKKREKGIGENKNKYLTGFTLVEMITALAIFSVVMLVAMGALLSVLNANKQTQATQTAVNNLSLAMEMMSREIRTGYSYHCGSVGVFTQTQDCPTGENFIAFEPYNGNSAFSGDQVIFKLENNQIKESTDGGSSFLSLTSPELVVENLRFCVVGSDITDDLQPKVLLTVYGYVDKGSVGDKGKSYFNLQTTVSQRLIDF
ncbi:MAG: type II secretion system protein [Candidatus Pacebacteria bacterium]|nr:type II secretion system protein [Candidatus Paceibacterota bacterium]